MEIRSSLRVYLNLNNSYKSTGRWKSKRDIKKNCQYNKKKDVRKCNRQSINNMHSGTNVDTAKSRRGVRKNWTCVLKKSYSAVTYA